MIKAKEGGNEIEERETIEERVRETRAAEKLPVRKLWTNDLSKLPKISYKEIIDYLVYGLCKFFQREDVKCF